MADAPSRKKIALKIAAVLLPAAAFVYVFAISLQYPLNDPDLWWHLKTGDYIVKNWEVPDVDPFAYTTPRPLEEGSKIGLRSQWLGQVIFYLADSVGGLPGIGYFRGFLIVLPMLVLYIWLVRSGLRPWTAMMVVTLPALFLGIQLFYSFERPQGISFNLALLACILIERVKRKTGEGKRFDHSYWLLPLVMALWSNIHAGFIVGNIIILIYAGVEALHAAYRLIRGSKPARPFFFVVCAAAIAASFLNPNTYKLFYSYSMGLVGMFYQSASEIVAPRGGGWVENVVLEFKPLYYFYKELGYDWLIFYWIMTGVLYLALLVKYWLRRKFDLAEFLTVSLVVFFANQYARGLMFSLTVMPFYIGKTVVEAGLPQLRFRVFAKGVVAAMLALTVGFSYYINNETPYVFKPRVTGEWITPWYPTRLVEFLKAANIPGPMYNFYTWGGFLIWSLYPQYQVFIDGRALDDTVNRTADSILKTYPGWESQLEAYNINFIIVPVVFRESGHIIPVATSLVNDNRWKLVFLRNNSALFVRDVPQNKAVIELYNRDKKAIYQEILSVENIFLVSMPQNPVINLARADALVGLGMHEEARAIYERFRGYGGEHGIERLKAMGY